MVQDQYGAIGPYAYKGNQWVSFDDNAQIRKKSEYIKQMGLGGGTCRKLSFINILKHTTQRIQ